MATRFYWSSIAADLNLGGPVSGGGIWESSIGSIGATKKARTVRGATSIAAVSVVVGNGTNPNDVLYWQGISDPLAAQTISGNISGVCCCRENTSINTNAFTQLGAFVVDGSGNRVATLKGQQTTGGTEFNNPSANNRVFPRGGAAAVTSYACAAGDRIVLEVGVRLETTRTGDTVTLYIGDAGGSDLPLGDGTSNNLTINPWIEFANTLSFATLTPKRNRAMFLG